MEYECLEELHENIFFHLSPQKISFSDLHWAGGHETLSYTHISAPERGIIFLCTGWVLGFLPTTNEHP